MGKGFAGTLTEREIVWLMEKEYACTAQDVVWAALTLGASDEQSRSCRT